MYVSRSIDNELLNWKNSSKRKPLLIRGARQIGKTSAIRHLGEQFTHFAEINFDDNLEFTSLFESNLSPDEICQQLAILINIPIIENNLGVTLRKNYGSGFPFPLFFIWRKKSPNKKRAPLQSLTQNKI